MTEAEKTAGEAFPPLSRRFPEAALAPAGSLRITPGGEKAMRLSIGCETLDRDYWDFDRGFPALKELFPGWARIQSGWAKCEKSPGVYDFAWLDHIVDGLLSIGIRPWMCVCFGNPVYYGPGTWIRTCPMTLAPEVSVAWERYLEKLAAHYKDRVDHFEIWNEPDLGWGEAQLDGKYLYAEFVKLSSRALRRGNSDAFLIGGSMACGPRNTTRYGGFALADLFFGSGVGEYINAYSCHAYDVFPELVQAPEEEAFRRVLRRHGLEHLPRWQGEGGCPAAWQKDNALSKHPWNEAKQARHLLRNILCDLRGGAEISSYFMLSDFTYRYDDGTLGPCHYGLLAHPDYRKRPSFYAFQSLCRLFAGRIELNDELLFSLHKTDDQRSRITIEESAGIDALRVSIQRYCLVNGDTPLLAWHRPVNPHVPEKMFLNTMLIEGKDAEGFLDPLLLDPVTQALWRPQKIRREEKWGGSRVRIDDLPVEEYPLFLAPASFFR